MSHRLLVVPTARGVGLTSVCLGLVRALDRLGVRHAFVKPIGTASGTPDRSSALIRLTTELTAPEPIPRREAEDMLGEGKEALLLERVVEQVERASRDADVVVVEGLVPVADVVYATRLNIAMAEALDAELVLVAAPGEDDPVKVADNVDIAARAYEELGRDGHCCILNKVRSKADDQGPSSMMLAGPAEPRDDIKAFRKALAFEHLHPLGIIPFEPELAALRVKQLADGIGAKALNEGRWIHRRVREVALCAATVKNAAARFRPGTLVITPGDRDDILLAAALAELQGAQLAGVLLTGGWKPDGRVLELCKPALNTGLPLLSVASDSYTTAAKVHDVPRDVPRDDRERAEVVMNFIASHLDSAWLAGLAKEARTPSMTTPAFRYRLVERARAAKRIIVMPEGDEPRTVTAASICAERGIAEVVLLGEPDAIEAVARRQGVSLGEGVRIVDPREVKHEYVAPMVSLRKHKGLTEAAASDQLGDTVVLGTMMLKQDEVHGLVSGAVHTTANTIRPALQLIKTAPDSKLVSSVFFMCLPTQVLVYGDCAVNPNPNAEQLAEIALQCADSAAAFGIEPCVAMISYSTGSSGAGEGVDKVVRATAIAKKLRPELLIDGPLQYDAAAVAEVGKKKAPSSPVAGQATVFVFPDLNTGNTTYKAVQRSANVVSMGPMLQGLAKPVNDLSRGASVEDIVFTIALTAIQPNEYEVAAAGLFTP
jgi:phosphate acetyltransferase